LANGLAFSALFAVIPTVILVLGLAGLLVNDPATQQALVEAMASAFPPLRELLENILGSLTESAAITSVVAFIGLVWTVSQFRGALDVAFARIFAGQPERDIVRRTVLGIAWVAILLVAIFAVIVLGSLAALIDAFLPGSLPVAGSIARLLTSGPALLGLSILVVGFVYRTLPPRAPPWGSIGLPAVIVGLTVVILTQIFSFLVPRLIGSVALAGSLAAAFIALAWFSFSFQALLYGAAWVRVRDDPTRFGGGKGGSASLGGPAAPAEPGSGGE
jgi:uncharacterized BrkB/YihY/UPF0761 family membrane protein